MVPPPQPRHNGPLVYTSSNVCKVKIAEGEGEKNGGAKEKIARGADEGGMVRCCLWGTGDCRDVVGSGIEGEESWLWEAKERARRGQTDRDRFGHCHGQKWLAKCIFYGDIV